MNRRSLIRNALAALGGFFLPSKLFAKEAPEDPFWDTKHVASEDVERYALNNLIEREHGKNHVVFWCDSAHNMRLTFKDGQYVSSVPRRGMTPEICHNDVDVFPIACSFPLDGDSLSKEMVKKCFFAILREQMINQMFAFDSVAKQLVKDGKIASWEDMSDENPEILDMLYCAMHEEDFLSHQTLIGDLKRNLEQNKERLS